MNHDKKIDKMKKFITQYGVFTEEYHRPPDAHYKTGSYFANFQSERFDLSCSVGDTNKYRVYKYIAEEIKRLLKTENEKK